MRWLLTGAAAAAAAAALYVASRHLWRRLQRPPGLVIRCALDIGSGQHKLLVAKVHVATGHLVQTLHKEQQQVLLNHALVQDASGALSEEVLARSRSVLAAFKRKAADLGATEHAGVCTAVFRRACNGQAYLDAVNRELRLNLRIVSQSLEGTLGYLSAASGAREAEASASLVAWDRRTLTRFGQIGCGSFQLSARVDGRLRVWEGPIGDSDVTGLLLRQVQRKEFVGSGSGRTSPNPVSPSEAEALENAIRSKVPQPPDWLLERCALPSAKLVGFGERTCIFAVAAQLCGSSEMDDTAISAALAQCVGVTDDELRARWVLHDEEDMAVPKLMLLRTVLRIIGARRLSFLQTMGTCEGVLLCEELWTSAMRPGS